jgi:4-hydroxybenzoate polyprenyltransferase
MKVTTPRVVAIARACHLQPTLAVTGFVTALCLAGSRGWGSLSAALAVLSGQVTVGWSNDFIDRDRDRVAGRTDKPIATGEVDANLIRHLAQVAGVVCIPLSLLSGWRAAGVHLAAVAIALGYNRWLKTTVLSVLPYVVAFGLLPAFVSLGSRGHRWPAAWVMLAAALLGAGAHFLNTLPDLAADALVGLRGLPHRLGATGSLLAGVALVAAATTLVAFASRKPFGTIGILLTAADALVIVATVVAAASGRPRAAWTLSLGVAAGAVALYILRAA